MTPNDSYDFSLEQFADRLGDTVSATGKTQYQFGEMVGITSSTISRYLTCKQYPDLRVLIKIAKTCRVSIDWLIGLSDKSSETLGPESRNTALLYSLASPEDKQVIDLILSKYQKST